MSLSISIPKQCGRRNPIRVAARALFTELEFTTLVQDFLSESIELGETDYREATERSRGRSRIAAAKKLGGMLAIALESSAAAPLGHGGSRESAMKPEASNFR